MDVYLVLCIYCMEYSTVGVVLQYGCFAGHTAVSADDTYAGNTPDGVEWRMENGEWRME